MDGIKEQTRRHGIDRRSALKKAAVAGAIAWTAPAILSSHVHATDFIPGTMCTARCLPTGTISVVGNMEGCACIPGLPPGQQPAR